MDGLPDFAEDVVGTSPSNPDTDNDGVDDRTELLTGSDPGGRSTILPRAVVKDDLEAPGDVDVWRLVLSEPSRVYFQVLGIATDGAPIVFDWFAADDSLVGGSAGTPVFPDRGDTWLPELRAGVYRVSVKTFLLADDGSYRFRVYLPTTDERELIIGEPHEGAIQVPGDIDRWTFEGSAGDEVFFDMKELVARSDVGAVVELHSPSGAVVFTSVGFPDAVDLTDMGPFTLTENGTYELVFGKEFLSDVFDYRFTLGGLQSSGGGSIAEGARESGMLEATGDNHEWTFSGSTGDRVFFELTEAAQPMGDGLLEISILAPNGSELSSSFGAPGAPEIGSLGPLVLPQTGTYRVILRGTAADFSYEFILYRSVPETRALTVGAATDGEIVVPGEADDWTFFATAGDSLTLDLLLLDSGDELTGYEFELFDPSGARVFLHRGLIGFGVIDDPDPVALSTTGTYRLQVRGGPNVPIGYAYRFRVLL